MAVLSFLSRKRSTASSKDQESSVRRDAMRRESDDPLDPEYVAMSRARHRLIGSIFLTLVVLASLPFLLGDIPKAPEPRLTLEKQVVGDPVTALSASSPVRPLPFAGSAVLVASGVNPEKTASSVTPNVLASAQSVDHPTTNTTPASAVVAKTITPGEAELAARSKRFVMQIGGFSTDARAKLWVARLKDMSIPSFVDHRKGDEERFYVKAGPFGDAATAQEVGEKIRIATGVVPKLIELP